MKALTTLFVVGMFLTTVAIADDADDVEATVLKYIAAVNAGDTEGRAAGRSPDWSTFGRGGSLLARTASVEAQKKAFQRKSPWLMRSRASRAPRSRSWAMSAPATNA